MAIPFGQHRNRSRTVCRRRASGISPKMITALIRAIEEVFTRPLRHVVMLSLALAVGCFAGLWIGIALVAHNTSLFGWWPLDWIVDLFGALGVLLLSWLLFPAVVTMMAGFFLERVAGAVEARDYPALPPPRGMPVYDMLAATLRLMILTIVLNLLALPLYLFLPGINFFVFLALNGYLFGRAYFEVVAFRRLDRGTAKAVRQRFAGRVFIGGLVITGLFSLPFVNLVAPVIATAFMVHVFESLRRVEPRVAAS
jgi:CysZ protein